MVAEHLFIVRHGETEANVKGIEAGPMDYALTKRDVKGAEFIAENLSKIKIDAILVVQFFVLAKRQKFLPSHMT